MNVSKLYRVILDIYITSLIKIYDNLIACVSVDNTIMIWRNYECFNTLTGHKSGVNLLIKNNENIIVCGSRDKTIKIWINFLKLLIKFLYEK